MQSFVDMKTVEPSQRKSVTHGYICHEGWPICEYDFSDWTSLEYFAIVTEETVNRELLRGVSFKFPPSIRVTNIYGLETTYSKDGVFVSYDEETYDKFYTPPPRKIEEQE